MCQKYWKTNFMLTMKLKIQNGHKLTTVANDADVPATAAPAAPPAAAAPTPAAVAAVDANAVDADAALVDALGSRPHAALDRDGRIEDGDEVDTPCSRRDVAISTG